MWKLTRRLELCLCRFQDSGAIPGCCQRQPAYRERHRAEPRGAPNAPQLLRSLPARRRAPWPRRHGQPATRWLQPPWRTWRLRGTRRSSRPTGRMNVDLRRRTPAHALSCCTNPDSTACLFLNHRMRPNWVGHGSRPCSMYSTTSIQHMFKNFEIRSPVP